MRIGRGVAIVAVGLAVAGLVTSCQLATVFTVNSVVDAPDAAVGDGVCASAGDGCTLRAAVQEANSRSGAVEIDLGNAEHYILSVVGANEDASATGDLDVSGSLTIVGHGSMIDAADIDRVVQVTGQGRLALRGVTLTGGHADLGAGIRVDAGTSAQISQSTITGNIADGWARCNYALFSFPGFVCSDETTSLSDGLRDHTGEGGGAGIWNRGTLSVWDSTISANAIPALPESDGCYTFIHGANCDIHLGAGLLNYATANLVNVTISGNSIDEGFGAGLVDGRTCSQPPFTTILTCVDGHSQVIFGTIVANTQTPPANWFPGPLPLPSQGSTLVGAPGLAGTAIDGSTPICEQDLTGSSLGYNVASDGSCFSGGTDRSNTIGGLGPLADNGGPTLTHLPLTGSSLIDSIPTNASLCASVIRTDQRGASRLSGQPCTVGSVEP